MELGGQGEPEDLGGMGMERVISKYMGNVKTKESPNHCRICYMLNTCFGQTTTASKWGRVKSLWPGQFCVNVTQARVFWE